MHSIWHAWCSGKFSCLTCECGQARGGSLPNTGQVSVNKSLSAIKEMHSSSFRQSASQLPAIFWHSGTNILWPCHARMWACLQLWITMSLSGESARTVRGCRFAKFWQGAKLLLTLHLALYFYVCLCTSISKKSQYTCIRRACLLLPAKTLSRASLWPNTRVRCWPTVKLTGDLQSTMPPELE